GLTLYPRLVRNKGMERANVQDDPSSSSWSETGVWNSIKSTFKGFGSKNKQQDGKTSVGPKKAEINIFSVASGHLYERFLSIMILSVMKNTKSSVKFWFIENFL